MSSGTARDRSELVGSIRAEYLRYKALADAALYQVDDANLGQAGPGGGNSIEILVRHLAGNLRSRFTDFLISDGEKPWRQRDREFAEQGSSREQLGREWEDGWAALLATLAALTDEELGQTVAIRGQSLRVHEALHRSLAHVAYHVGQIVYLARSIRGERWTGLSIPRGGSEAYNRDPRLERAVHHRETLERSDE